MGIADLQLFMDQVTKAKAEFEEWKPKVNSWVTELEHTVNYLKEKMEHYFRYQSKHTISDADSPDEHPKLDPKFSVGKKVARNAHLEPNSFESSPVQFGHRRENKHHNARFEVVYTTPDPPPVTGAKSLQHPSIAFSRVHELRRHFYHYHHDNLPAGVIPEYDFPKFDGCNPKS